MKNLCSLMLVICALACGSCMHAQQTRAQEQAQPAAPAKSARPPTPETMTTSKTTKQMFKPEGLKKLQAALATKGTRLDSSGLLDSETQEALRAYQSQEGLPATGLPDYETLRRLGIKPDEVFHRDPPSERVGVQ